MTGSASASESSPKVFDSRYYIYEIVGRGASSVVYRAKHVLNDKRELALKVLLPQNGKEFNSDLLRHESLALITARHSYVIRLEDFRSVDNICYLAMEYAPLHNLAKYYQENKGNIILAQLERYLLQITEAISFMHNIGMCHRDIKPENILLINDRQARLSDLGMTTLPGQKTSVEELKKGVGTFDYMPPEVLKGNDFDERADVYSLGLTFYELFSGEHPFKNLSLGQSLIARESQPIIPLNSINEEIPDYISNAISRCLQPNPDDRFISGIELLEYLKNKGDSDEGMTAAASEHLVSQASDKEEISVKAPVEPQVAVNPFAAQNSESSTEDDDIDEEDPFEEDDYTSQAGKGQEAEVANFINDYTEDQAEPEEGPYSRESSTESEQDFYMEESEGSEDEFVGDRSETNFNDFNYQQDYAEKHSSPLWQTILFWLIAGLIVYLLYSYFFASGGEQIESKQAELRTSETLIENFRQIPKGVYNGELKGFYSEQSVPLSLISMGESGQVAILLGVPGWQPQIFDISNNKADKSIEFSSNGIVIKLDIVNHDSEQIYGNYYNLSSDTKGSWFLRQN